MKTSKRKGGVFSSFPLFLSLSLSHEYFFPPKIFLLLSDEKFFSRRTPTKTLQKTTPQTTRFARVYVLFYIL